MYFSVEANVHPGGSERVWQPPRPGCPQSGPLAGAITWRDCASCVCTRVNSHVCPCPDRVLLAGVGSLSLCSLRSPFRLGARWGRKMLWGEGRDGSRWEDLSSSSRF